MTTVPIALILIVRYECVVSFLFFFSSRRRHTRFDCDWSSDVCSSDLVVVTVDKGQNVYVGNDPVNMHRLGATVLERLKGAETAPVYIRCDQAVSFGRSEERRVGKECRSRWSPYH